MKSRPSKHEYYLKIAEKIGSRSTCFRNKIGVVILTKDQIAATGYIGAPRKTKDCIVRGNCLRNKLNISHGSQYEICRSVHAEQNAIINAARAGTNIFDGIMYIAGMTTNNEKINMFPCFICKKMIINSGIKKVICSMKNNKFKIFVIKEWIEDWQKKDIIKDKYQYGQDQNKKYD